MDGRKCRGLTPLAAQETGSHTLEVVAVATAAPVREGVAAVAEHVVVVARADGLVAVDVAVVEGKHAR